MKKILITGANSYVGTSFEKWLSQWPDEYHVDTIDMIDGTWREKSFAGYDVVFHVAGIAHVKETKENEHVYYKVNRDLAFEAARKAKMDGVSLFIFLSSMSVYGLLTGTITKETIPIPRTNYGKSKLEAEHLIFKLLDDRFKVAILRPPMIYGKGCKGNYPKLSALVKKIRVFPKIENRRSMVYVENLCDFIQQIIESATMSSGIFFPQNSEYVDSSSLVSVIASVNNVKIIISKVFIPLAYFVKITKPTIYYKVFGDLLYGKDTYSIGSYKRQIIFEESIRRTEQ